MAVALGLLVAASACSGTEADQAHQYVCSQLDNLSIEQMDAIFDNAVSDLEAAGVSIDRSTWSDPARFGQFMDALAQATGCPELSTASITSANEAKQALGADSNYCGPGHDSLLTPSVDPCLNEACRNHDACYAQCNIDVGPLCTWSSVTRPCDDVFMGTAHTCPIHVNPFRSRMVIDLADKMYKSTFADSCPPGASCPKPPTLGNGPCGAQPDAVACTDCLDKYDPQRTCLDQACNGNAGDYVCYAATCDVSACYGGWDQAGSGGTGGTGGSGGSGGFGGSGGTAGTGGAGGSSGTGGSGGSAGSGGSGGSGGVDPTSLWDVVLVSGTIPSTNLGSDWDALGDPPDPIVTLQVGSSTSIGFTSSEASNTYTPSWNETLATAVPASALMTYIAFTVEDSDVIVNDSVGACEWQLPEADFSGALIPFSCPQSSTQAGFDLTFYVTPH